MKNIAILIEDNYQILEVWYPYFRLIEAGFKVKLVGTGTKGIYLSKEGYPAEAEADIDKIASSDFDGVVIPGGFAPDILRRFGKVNSFVKEICQAGKLTASICHGAWVLVSADILKGRKATCFYAIKDDCINAGADYKDQEVVVDKNLITSRKPEDLPAFLAEIIKFLNR